MKYFKKENNPFAICNNTIIIRKKETCSHPEQQPARSSPGSERGLLGRGGENVCQERVAT